MGATDAIAEGAAVEATSTGSGRLWGSGGGALAEQPSAESTREAEKKRCVDILSVRFAAGEWAPWGSCRRRAFAGEKRGSTRAAPACQKTCDYAPVRPVAPPATARMPPGPTPGSVVRPAPMVTDDGDGLEKFFRCPLCKLPHEATTTTCPITGRPVPAPRQSRRARAASAVPDAALAPPAVAQGAAVPVGPGHLLDRKYLLGKRLGEGGMGVVYEATHVLLARPVAVKLLRTGAGFDASFESRFLKEGRNLASVAHPHVVNVFDFGVASGVQYLVMERLEGESLESRIEREGPLDLGAAFEIARQVLGGLAAAHALGIVHRDLKPGNVFLVQSEDDEAIHVKLIDFGISAQAAVAESEPRVAGSPSYLPPEQARGEPADVRADIYSFGATMYETLTGRPPLMVDGLANLLAAIQLDVPSPPSRWRPGLSPELDRMLLKTLAKRPEDRFSSAEEVLAQCIALEPRAAIAPRRYVLVADANPAGGEVCRRVAKALGRAVFVVRDGLDALEITKEKGLPELLVATLSCRAWMASRCSRSSGRCPARRRCAPSSPLVSQRSGPRRGTRRTRSASRTCCPASRTRPRCAARWRARSPA